MLTIYAPLNRERKEIRLLRILPSSDELETKCSLKTVSLLDQSDFEALSYCWGDPSVTTQITLCGREVSVTLNLGHALKQFRESAQTA
ncbi:hypothetical protein AC579_5068 [Pseudocercospora musae]|uniref:Heterokaryon incompatibility domain-containing protein n=1 Tax=Pseudocercospora musae TaxID=113226 RepID=A0A139HDW7_9PEZI|nr:hypothetical protein AC579_5068 [Pseudocercospora musae]